jgi:hypothetical protein
VSSSRLVDRVAGPGAKWPSLLTGEWIFPLVYLLPNLDGMTTDNAPRMDTAALAATYFGAWKAHDFEEFRSILADDVTFTGPLGQAGNADECVKGIQGMSQIMTDVVIRKTFIDGPDILTWFDLHTKVTEDPLPVANWSHVTDGKISSIQVTFDPRPLTSGAGG